MYLQVLLSAATFFIVGYFLSNLEKANMPEYKLRYFNAKGRAEHIRFIFAYAGVDYEDDRIPREKWAEIKAQTPFGQLPLLEIDGKQVAQSNAVARHLAKKFGLAGKNEWEELQCDVLVDTLGDALQGLMQVRREQDPAKKEELKAKLTKETLPFYLSKFDKIVKENNGFTVGSGITWTDFVFAIALEHLEKFLGEAIYNQYPSLKALKEKVYSLEKIAQWVAKRPETEM